MKEIEEIRKIYKGWLERLGREIERMGMEFGNYEGGAIREMREIRYRLGRSRRDVMAIREITGSMRKLDILRDKRGRERHINEIYEGGLGLEVKEGGKGG